jgi:hypothetical protein
MRRDSESRDRRLKILADRNAPVNPDFELAKDEKVIFGPQACYIHSWGSNKYSLNEACHVIVTNQRIAIGKISGKAEAFGSRNYWHYSLPRIPKTKGRGGLAGLLADMFGSRDWRIANITYGKDEVGEFILLEPKFITPIRMWIYHPRSKEIFQTFGQSG